MNKVYEAIAAVQGELAIVGIAKNKKNKQGEGYMFRGIDDVYNELAPLLSKHKLCILPRIIERECVERLSKNGNALFYTCVTAEFDLVSAEDSSLHTVRSYGEAMDSGDKGTNKAMSTAYKTMAFMAFCIPTEGDNDTENQTHEVKPQRQHQPAKPAAQIAPVDPKDAEYHQRIKDALKAQYGDDKQAALDKVEELTSFIPKGKTEAERVKGVRDFTKLTGQRLQILCHNVEKLAGVTA